MKFGSRDICDVVFKAKADTVIGSSTFKKGQPVLYIDTATASTLEQAATTVYAQGGKGNSRLIAWEGEKTLTFSITDALLSPIGFSVLSGAGLFKSTEENQEVHVHATANAYISISSAKKIEIDLSDSLEDGEAIDAVAPVFVTITDSDNSLTGALIEDLTVVEGGKKLQSNSALDSSKENSLRGASVFVDFYIVKKSANVSEIQIDASNFGGYYYVEASTLFRRQSDGVDMPCEITLPNVKIQSNFTFQMAASGDPSTFEFKMDAFPGYTLFDKTHKVLCVMQIIEDAIAGTETRNSVMKHEVGMKIDESYGDSIIDTDDDTEE